MDNLNLDYLGVIYLTNVKLFEHVKTNHLRKVIHL